MKTPWHLWAIGAVSFLWNLGGAVDYTMSKLRIESYIGAMTEAQRAWFESFPAWATAFWALGVWGALAGSALLLGRSRLAVAAFVVSLLGILGNVTHTLSALGSDGAAALMGPGALAFSAAIILVALALFLYARAMARRGVLR